MGKLISLVKQPVPEDLTVYLHSGCSSEMHFMEIQRCSHPCSWQCLWRFSTSCDRALSIFKSL